MHTDVENVWYFKLLSGLFNEKPRFGISKATFSGSLHGVGTTMSTLLTNFVVPRYLEVVPLPRVLKSFLFFREIPDIIPFKGNLRVRLLRVIMPKSRKNLLASPCLGELKDVELVDKYIIMRFMKMKESSDHCNADSKAGAA